MAEEAGWNHASAGPTEDTRRLALWQNAEGDHLDDSETGPSFDDADIADVLERVLKISMKDKFLDGGAAGRKSGEKGVSAGRGVTSAGTGMMSAGRGMRSAGTGIEATGKTVSLEGFVSAMMPLLELEKVGRTNPLWLACGLKRPDALKSFWGEN